MIQVDPLRIILGQALHTQALVFPLSTQQPHNIPVSSRSSQTIIRKLKRNFIHCTGQVLLIVSMSLQLLVPLPNCLLTKP